MKKANVKIFFFVLLVSLFSCKEATAAPFPDPQVDPIDSGTDIAVLAGGCFWGVEAVFEKIDGVDNVDSGYSGGSSATANYDQVGKGTTGHAEAVEIRYDASKVSYGTLLKVFFHVAHDPTQLNYQGPDHGTQYRSAIFYRNEKQRQTAESYITQLQKARVFDAKIVTEVTKLTKFFPAEKYHQDFMKRNPNHPYIQYWDRPKIEHLEKAYPQLIGMKQQDMDLWYGYEVLGPDKLPPVPVTYSDQEWKKRLGEMDWKILRHAGTEPAFSGTLLNEKRKGIYYSKATGQPLFASDTKFKSGTGWPSFSGAVSPEAVILRWDTSYGMRRVEVLDSSSGSHLGHVFDDGPSKSAKFPRGTGLRFCINSASLIFVADGDKVPELVAQYTSN